jgi:hypothetical protein
MTRFERECLSRNLAEAINDLYAIPRPRERRIPLVAKQVERAIYRGWQEGMARAPIDSEEDQLVAAE